MVVRVSWRSKMDEIGLKGKGGSIGSVAIIVEWDLGLGNGEFERYLRIRSWSKNSADSSS